jgi:hypothetical protein
LPFGKNHRVFRKNRSVFYLVECFDRLLGEVAKKIAGAQMAIKTAFDAVQSGHTHWRSSIFHKNTRSPDWNWRWRAMLASKQRIEKQQVFDSRSRPDRPLRKVMTECLHAGCPSILGLKLNAGSNHRARRGQH